MAVPNPDYKPNWLEMHNFHMGQCKRLSGRWDCIDEARKHLAEAQTALSVYQHETIQDAAQWLFEDTFFCKSYRSHPLYPTKYDQFETIHEINALYNLFMDIVRPYRDTLNIGKPIEKDTFKFNGHVIQSEDDLIRVVLERKRSYMKPYENLDASAAYTDTLHSWNCHEERYRSSVFRILRDYISLQSSQSGSYLGFERRHGVMRDIVSNFENYALETAKAFMYNWGPGQANSRVKKVFAHKFQETESYEQSAYFAVQEEYKKIQGVTRGAKIIKLYNNIGYPVSGFENTRQEYKKNWTESLTEKFAQSADMFGIKLEHIPDYLLQVEEFITKRNMIEHESNKGFDIYDSTILSYANASFIMMNHMKLALDNHMKGILEKGHHFQSGIVYSPTLDPDTIYECWNGVYYNSLKDEKALEVMKEWISYKDEPSTYLQKIWRKPAEILSAIRDAYEFREIDF